jgi:catechol 2,3-dioxygenase-like lactoylglutathione lyase family enzyme
MTEQTEILWQGFHHIALVTPDFDGTLAFYRDVLGMQIGQVFPAEPERGRHGFIRPGDGATWGIHLFEYAEADLLEPVPLTERYAFRAGALQHIAFALPDEAAALQLRTRLEQHQVEMTPIGTIGPLRNFMFTDINGLMLEAAWPNKANTAGA